MIHGKRGKCSRPKAPTTSNSPSSGKPESSPTTSRVMESVLEMMKAVGVRVKLQQFEPGGDISSWRQGKTGDWDVLGNGYGNQTGLALTTLQGMYAGTAEKEATRDTYHGYVFPEITAKIQAASSEPDPTKRAALLGRRTTRHLEHLALPVELRTQRTPCETHSCTKCFTDPDQLLRPRRRPIGGLRR